MPHRWRRRLETMPRLRSRQQQLDLEGAHIMTWDDVPTEVQDRLRALLGDLLRHAARRGGAAEGPADE
jgi:hypothetical protein